MVIQPLERDALRKRFDSAQPFRFLAIDDFLEPAFAREVAAAYPRFEDARQQGFEFRAVNELRKVQITDSSLFPDPVRRLHEALASPAFLDDLVSITGIPALLADPLLAGGGIHVTGPRGRLDVHVDFNLIEDRGLHRRLNILVFLNPEWREDWGGQIELWDADVRRRHHSFLPIFNRCVLFETSRISFHGVAAVRCPAETSRRSFAAYYYTKEAPAGWDGTVHSTIFQARPDERFRGWVLMPAERAWHRVRSGMRSAGRDLRRRLGGR